MGRTKKVLTKEQQRLVDNVTAINERRRREEPLMYKRIKQLVQEEMGALLSAEDMAVREAVNAGVPLAEFRRKESGLHTSDTGAVLRSLKRTEALAAVAAEAATVEADPVFRMVGTTEAGEPLFTVTPPTEDLEQIVAGMGAHWEEDEIPGSLHYKVLANGWPTVNGSTRLPNLSPHPVPMWADRHKDELREWVRDNVAPARAAA